MPIEGTYAPSPFAMAAEQVEQYEATGGEEGGSMMGASCVILHTRGRKTGQVRKSPLIKVERDGRYAVIASMGGAPTHPVWYLNLVADPRVSLQDGPDVRDYRARTATGEERADWWSVAVAAWPAYDEYQTKTDREIPVVLLDPLD